MTITRSKSGMRNQRKNLKPTATSMTPKKRSRKEKTDDMTTTPTLDLKDNMTDNQQESSPNENLVDDTPPSPDLLERKSSMEHESAMNQKEDFSRKKKTKTKEDESKNNEESNTTRNTLLEKVQNLTDISDTSSSASSESDNMEESENVTSNKGMRLKTKKKSMNVKANMHNKNKIA